ncbi:PREDICTED: transcription elongation factor TFIIS-like [Nelumbo nucifera]|uniref:Transcription elongation factor TFIIS-like n=1 Tax=Nelumbo nucifera TaxID=4432 RepID=A0A1U8QBD8_NELNU|nr:PREDICTED: transcription elongation factor TFIIS-like [Nelumbo nucifera]
MAGNFLSCSKPRRRLRTLLQQRGIRSRYAFFIDTQVGKRVRLLTKHPRQKIQAMASDLIEIWKRVVIEETTKNKKNGCSDNKDSMKPDVAKAETVKVEKVQKAPDSVRVEKVSRVENVKVEKISRLETVKVEKHGDAEPLKIEKVPKEEKQAFGSKRPLQTPNGPPTCIRWNEWLYFTTNGFIGIWMIMTTWNE